MPTEIKDILPIMQAIAEGQACEDIWWRTDGEYAPVTFLVNCNDFFAWGCSDCEELTVEHLHVFVKACADDRTWGPQLYCARVRGERPQGACYRGMPKRVAEMFNACGPEREINLINPRPPTDGEA